MDRVSVICKLAMKWYLMRIYASWLSLFYERLTSGLAENWLSPRFLFLGKWEPGNAQWWKVENSCDLECLQFGVYKVTRFCPFKSTYPLIIDELLIEDSKIISSYFTRVVTCMVCYPGEVLHAKLGSLRTHEGDAEDNIEWKMNLIFYLRIWRYPEVIYFVYLCQSYHEIESRTHRYIRNKNSKN